MASLAAEEKVEMLLSVLRSIDAAPNMQTVADDLRLENRPTARRRYKGIVEADGNYLLTAENKIVAKGIDAGDDAAGSSAGGTTVTPRKRGRPKKVTDDADSAPTSAPKKARKTKAEKEAESKEVKTDTHTEEDDGDDGAVSV